jgi:hypothetical protein
MPSGVDDAKRWRSRPENARSIADEMVDPEARRTMWSIAAGYELLARHAESRKDRKEY